MDSNVIKKTDYITVAPCASGFLLVESLK
jgi:hypothetical protein